MYKDIAEFHQGILGVKPAPSPSLVSAEFCIERGRFLQEEVDEFLEASLTGNLVKTADALADIVYIALGTAYQMDLPFEAIWNAVHNANMRKVRGETKRGNSIDAKKPEGWVGPETEIARLIGGHIDAPK